jgi:F-type H+-transporting ATPase subunit b
MVSINATFFVLLGMFLVFLWAMHRFVLTPALSVMDARDSQVADAKNAALQDSQEAAGLEDTYAARIGAIHREANSRLIHARRSAQDKHNEQVDAFRRQAEEELRTQRRALRAEVAEQEKQIEPLAAQLSAAMLATLEME